MKQSHFFTMALTLALGITLSSCGQTGTSYQRSYVSSYVEPDAINLEERASDDRISLPLILQLSGKIHSKGTPLHKALSEKYKDKTYKNHTTPNLALSEEIVWIDLIAMSDLNTDFPVGSSLREYATMGFSSYYSYVQGGYKDENLLNIVKKRIYEFSANDLKMLQQGFSILSLGIEIDNPATNRLKLVIHFNSGRKHELEFTC